MRLNARNGEIEELKELVLEALPSFQEHVRIKCVKLDAVLRDQKDTGKTVLQCDFAMAYSCEYQNEIQSALWSRASVNLFTAVYHHDETAIPYLIVTDSKSKDKDSVYTFIYKF